MTLRDDIVAQMKAGSRLTIAASCFSIYAFQELKEALKDIKELRFIFTSPTFTTEKIPKQQREFYIPRLDRERTQIVFILFKSWISISYRLKQKEQITL